MAKLNEETNNKIEKLGYLRDYNDYSRTDSESYIVEDLIDKVNSLIYIVNELIDRGEYKND